MIAPTAVASLPAIPTPPAPATASSRGQGAASAFDALVQEFTGGAAPIVRQMPGLPQAIPVAVAAAKTAAVKIPAFISSLDRFKAPAPPKSAVAGKASAPVFRAPAQPVFSTPVPGQPVSVQPAAAQPVPLPAPAPAVAIPQPEIETSKVGPVKEQREAPQEAPSIAIPVVAAPVRRSAGATAQPVKSGTGAPVAVPVIAIAIPAPPPLPVVSTTAAPTSAGPGDAGGSKTSVTPTESQKTPERLSPNDVALQVNIKMPSDANAVPAAGPDPLPLKQPLRGIAETPVVPVPGSAATTAAVPPATVAPSHAAIAQARPAEDVTPPRSTVPEEPVTKEPAAATPLKSLSLEFTPDGAGDVRLRVTERAGEVHISLHSSDASLGGKLHDGVHDLVGNLSKAGYEAEAWTPGQGHQGNQQQQEQRRQQQPKSGEAGTEEFGNLYEQQPGQENS